jgi:uncharacterized membrane protein
MDTEEIRHELLDGDDDWLRTRRKIAAIAALLAAEFAVLGMRQYGVIRRLPDLPIRGFDANAVSTSRAAYPLGIPDASLAVVGAGALIVLATAGGSRRSGRAPLLDLALGAAIGVGAISAVTYFIQMVRQRRVCIYCIASTAGFLSLVPLAARGVVRAWHLVNHRAWSARTRTGTPPR